MVCIYSAWWLFKGYRPCRRPLSWAIWFKSWWCLWWKRRCWKSSRQWRTRWEGKRDAGEKREHTCTHSQSCLRIRGMFKCLNFCLLAHFLCSNFSLTYILIVGFNNLSYHMYVIYVQGSMSWLSYAFRVYVVGSYQLVMLAWERDRLICQDNPTHQDGLMY